MKKAWIGWMVFLLLAVSFSLSGFAESPKLNVKVSVSSEMVKKGETFDVTVSLYNYGDKTIQDIGGLQFDIPLDTEYLEYVDKSDKMLLKTETGDFVSAAYNRTMNQYTFLYAYMNADGATLPRDNTDVFSFQLKLKKEIPDGKTLDISCKAAVANAQSPAQPIPADVFFAQICSSESASPKNDNPPTSGGSTNPPPVKQEDKVVVPITPGGALTWDRVVIDGSNITARQTEEGVLLRGDNLSGITVTAEKEDQELSVKIDTDKKEVLLKEDEGGSMGAYIDSDGDGTFETSLSQRKINQDLILMVAIGIAVMAAIVLLLILWRRKRTSD